MQPTAYRLGLFLLCPVKILLYMILGRFMYVFLLECWVRGIHWLDII